MLSRLSAAGHFFASAAGAIAAPLHPAHLVGIAAPPHPAHLVGAPPHLAPLIGVEISAEEEPGLRPGSKQ